MLHRIHRNAHDFEQTNTIHNTSSIELDAIFQKGVALKAHWKVEWNERQCPRPPSMEFLGQKNRFLGQKTLFIGPKT